MALTVVKTSALSGNINLTSQVTGTLPVASGGTGLTSGTTDQFLKFTGTTTIASAVDNAGKVLQTTSANTTSTAVSSSSSYSAFGNGMDLTLTPSSTSNYFLVIFSTNFDIQSDNRQGNYGLWREIGGDASTNVSLGQMIQLGGSQTKAPGAFIYKDAPSTTSAVRYRIPVRATTGNEILFGGYFGANTSLTIMEIAG